MNLNCKSNLFAGFLLLSLVGCSSPAENSTPQAVVHDEAAKEIEIPMLALNEVGETVLTTRKQSKYKRELAEIMESVQESTLPALSQTAATNPWGLRTVVVGIGMKLDLSLGPIGVGINPGMRFAYSNSAKPSIP